MPSERVAGDDENSRGEIRLAPGLRFYLETLSETLNLSRETIMEVMGIESKRTVQDHLVDDEEDRLLPTARVRAFGETCSWTTSVAACKWRGWDGERCVERRAGM